jgi:hypothetical protein
VADYLYDDETPNQTGFDGTWHTFAAVADLAVAADLIGGRAWFPATTPTNFVWLVYDASDESVVAQVDLTALPSPTGNAWNTFTSSAFASPGDVALDAGEYRVAFATDGDFPYSDAPDYPVAHNAVITSDAGAYFNGGSGPVYPDEAVTTDFQFFADMLVDAGGGEDPHEGSAAPGIALALTAAGGVDHVASIASGIGLALDAAGSTDRAGAATPAIGLALAAAGSTQHAGAAAAGIDLSVAAAGSTEYEGGATPGIRLQIAAAGARPSLGAAALQLGLALLAAATPRQIPGVHHTTLSGPALTAGLSGPVLTAATSP